MARAEDRRSMGYGASEAVGVFFGKAAVFYAIHRRSFLGKG